MTMTNADVLLIATAITAAIVQLMKKTAVLNKVKDVIEWIAIAIGIGVFYVYAMNAKIEVTIWSSISNGLIVGLSAIGLYQTVNTVPGTPELLK
jgi:hypothetical protein